jgi:hypothetical protein
MPVGRPTTYNQEVLDKAREYIDNCPDVVPIVVGLCGYINRSKTVVYRWAQEPDKQEFKDILDEISEKQENQLIRGGLLNEFNSPIAKMMLAKHGYSDRQEVDHQSSDKSMSPASQSQAVLDAIKAKHDA